VSAGKELTTLMRGKGTKRMTTDRIMALTRDAKATPRPR
jgi:hypothetical protein